MDIKKITYGLMNLLRKLMYLWVRSKLIPAQTAEDLGFDLNKPICYVFRSRSTTDLMVLDHHCKSIGIPRPSFELSLGTQSSNKQARCLYLSKPGLVQSGQERLVPSGLLQIVEHGYTSDAGDVQIVPVSVFWGRNPGSEEKSPLKLLFTDDEASGKLQRFFTFFLQGRRVLCNLGKPISLKEFIKNIPEPEDATKKLRRILKVHFRRQRNSVLGPYIYDRNQVIESILRSKPVRDLIAKESLKTGQTLEKVEQRTRRYADEVAAHMSHNTIRFFDVIFTWVWKKIYSHVEVSNGERLREYAEKYELVYMPLHRSHMDYMLIGYCLYNLGYMPPHTAAGINLNFWPVGYFLRRGGGFFIRRSFGGDRLYSAVFNEYVHFLLTSGYPICFYPEGGRSRTGRALDPKTGMLSMVLQSYRRNSSRPIMLVPAYVGYDKLMEGQSYLKELRGAAKKKESIGGFLQARNVIRSRFGKAYINFGEPLSLDDFIKSEFPTWNNHSNEELRSTAEFHVFLNKLAHQMMIRNQNAAVLNPVALFSTAVLSAANKAVPLNTLIQTVNTWAGMLKELPYHKDVILPEENNWEALLDYSIQFSALSRFSHPKGDVVFVSNSEEFLLRYYRNNVLHIFALPSMIASFFQYQQEKTFDEIKEGVREIWPYFKEELFLVWSDEDLDSVITHYVEIMVARGLLVKTLHGQLMRPDVAANEFASLKLLSRILNFMLEPLCIFTLILKGHSDKGAVDIAFFQNECEQMYQKVTLLSGTHHSGQDVFDKKLFTNYISILKKRQLVKSQGEGIIAILPEFERFANSTGDLLSIDIRLSLEK